MSGCKLVIQDEVNIKFVGLDVDVRRKLSNSMKFFMPYARHTPQYKLGRWDGTVGFFGLGGNGYLNHLDRLIPILESSGIEISEIEDQRQEIDIKFSPIQEDFWGDVTWPQGHRFAGEKIRLRDDQVEVINRFLENPQALQEVSTGAGKCQPYDSKVLTPDGWKTIGKIKIGDKVITPSGSSVEVLEIYEPGIKDIYEITFQDGRVVKCCKDHIWRVSQLGWKNSKKGIWRNLSTLELMSQIANTRRSIGVPLVTMEKDDKDIDLPIHPWLMGFLLGDGSFRNGKLCFSTKDQELVNKVQSLLHPDYKVNHIANYDYCIKFKNQDVARKRHSELIKSKKRNVKGYIFKGNKDSSNFYIKQLLNLGLMETYSDTKFVPSVYFTASKKQRIELIQGLADSDGTIDKSSIYFCSTSKQLAEDFCQLIYSVGGIAKLKENKNRSYSYNGNQISCKNSYNVSTKFKTPWDLVSLKRKKEKTNFSYQYGPTLKLNVTEIKKLDQKERVRCIMIDDPDHLYVTDNYVVTHNTITTATMSKICEKYGRTVVIVPSKDLVTQTEEDYKNCGLDYGVYYGDRKDYGKTHTICTWQSLNIIDKNFKNGESEFSLEDFLDGIVAVIVDEVHQAKADVLKTILTTNLRHCPLRWGLTGTIPKEDHEVMSILASLGPVVGSVTAKELQDKGILAECEVNILQLIDILDFKSYQQELKYLVTNKERVTFIANKLLEISKTGNTLILVDRIETGEFLEKLLPQSTFVSGEVKSKDRKKAYKEINTSDNSITIATYGVAAVGINIPRIFNLVLLEPGKSFVRVIQSIGRGIRKANDKDKVNIWDISSTCKYAKKHLRERKKFYEEAQYPYNIKKVDWN